LQEYEVMIFMSYVVTLMNHLLYVHTCPFNINPLFAWWTVSCENRLISHSWAWLMPLATLLCAMWLSVH